MILSWLLLIFLFNLNEAYHSFQDTVYKEFGLVDEKNNNNLCLYLKFNAKLYNFNLNNTDIAFEVKKSYFSVIKILVN